MKLDEAKEILSDAGYICEADAGEHIYHTVAEIQKMVSQIAIGSHEDRCAYDQDDSPWEETEKIDAIPEAEFVKVAEKTIGRSIDTLLDVDCERELYDIAFDWAQYLYDHDMMGVYHLDVYYGM